MTTSIASPDLPPDGGGNGDPHCMTFDGLSFDCQAQGDFLLFRAESTQTTMQARFEKVPDIPQATWTTGIAVREDSSNLVEITITGGEISLLVDGVPYDEGTATLVGVELDINTTAIPPSYEITFPSGFEVVVKIYQHSGLWSYMNFHISVPIGLETNGLLGNNNGDMSDDWKVSTRKGPCYKFRREQLAASIVVEEPIDKPHQVR